MFLYSEGFCLIWATRVFIFYDLGEWCQASFRVSEEKWVIPEDDKGG